MNQEIDSVIRRVQHQASTWQALDRQAKCAILATLQQEVVASAPAWAAAACSYKQIDPVQDLAGEEWLTGPVIVLRYLRLLRDHLLRGGFPSERLGTRHLLPEEQAGADGAAAEESWVARVFPFERYDSLIYPGVRAEVWGLPGSQPTTGSPGVTPGGVAAVLGAGNISSIPPLDFLDQLFRHGRVVVVKLHPLTEPLRPVFEQAFRVLIAAGFLAFVSGDEACGAALVAHPAVAAVHLTGSERGFRGVVAEALGGPPPMNAIDAASGKHFSAELGAVTPVLVCPGPWSRRDLQLQAQQVAGMMAINNGYTCLTPKLLVTSRHWRQREAFLAALKQALNRLPPRPAWYPGAVDRWTRFVHEHGHAVSPHRADRLPFVLLEDVPADGEALALKEEAFCGILAECAVDADGAEAFLDAAVDLVNGQVYGSLSANLIAAPTAPRAAIERALARLRYGTVALNTWAGLGFGLGSCPWGAFPGHRLAEPDSGIGFVHNAFQFDHVEKTVLRAPFRPSRRPIYWPQRRRLLALGKGMVAFERDPGLGRLLRMLPAAYSLG